VACERFLQWRVIGRPPETQSSRGAGGSGLQGIGAAPGPAPGLPRAVECRKPSSERKHDNDDDVSTLPEAKRRIWRSLAKPKQARNFKDLKGLKCRYTFGIRALFLFNAGLTPATYSYADFRTHVVAALQKSFGADVKPGTNAIKIKANGSRRSADVIVATEFRRYYSGLGPQYEKGICFFTSAGDRIINYPKQHSANCTAKHQATSMWFKPMVRILKNMRSKLIDDGFIDNGTAPSHFLEGLLYNVPKGKFGKTYVETFVAAMNWIYWKVIAASSSVRTNSITSPGILPRNVGRAPTVKVSSTPL
jgi:hypothetical protein